MNCLDACILSKTMKRNDRGGRFRLRSNSDDDNELKPDREYDNNCVFQGGACDECGFGRDWQTYARHIVPTSIKELILIAVNMLATWLSKIH